MAHKASDGHGKLDGMRIIIENNHSSSVILAGSRNYDWVSLQVYLNIRIILAIFL